MTELSIVTKKLHDHKIRRQERYLARDTKKHRQVHAILQASVLSLKLLWHLKSCVIFMEHGRVSDNE